MNATGRSWARCAARIALVVATAPIALACNGESSAAALCKPGVRVFCRCEGGAPGAKRCNDAGDAFGECGPCNGAEAKPPPADTAGPDATSSAGSSSPGPGRPLLASCDTAIQCDSGVCEQGYCSSGCAKPSDCPYPDAECVPYHNETVCMRTCATAADCTDYGVTSQCGYTQSIDHWDVRVCAQWGDALAVMPPGASCSPIDPGSCSLGYDGRAVVCTADGVCAPGCFGPSDCPTGSQCDTTTSPGTCR